MVSHQAVGIELVCADFFAFSQNRKESKIILRVFKQLLMIDSPQHHMVDPGGAFLSLCSWHFRHPISFYCPTTVLSKKSGTQIRPLSHISSDI